MILPGLRIQIGTKYLPTDYSAGSEKETQMPDMPNGFCTKLLSNTGRLYKTIVADRNKNVSDPDPASKFANSDPDPT